MTVSLLGYRGLILSIGFFTFFTKKYSRYFSAFQFPLTVSLLGYRGLILSIEFFYPFSLNITPQLWGVNFFLLLLINPKGL